ncbi:CobN-like chelatase BtuS for metalloporphyrine salvage [hydrothermal vent metagenome]|uniref:CobN-like chelatase BtuS for metalloporphyrine salvage n=1 Tax=hydrothermal vent metagenome TaxID=652676 RepID=A0A3B0Z835_9ZZZZ
MGLKKIALIAVLAILITFCPLVQGEIKNTERSILILATNHVTEAKLQLLSDLIARKSSKPQNIKMDYKYLRSLEEDESLSDLVAPYDLIIFDAVSGRETAKDYERFEALVQADSERRFLPIKLTSESKLRKNISLAHSQALYDYYYNGGEENLHRMLVFLENEFFKLESEQALPPILFPKLGIYHPEYEKTVFDNIGDYREWKNAKVDTSMIGIAMSRETIAAGETKIIDALIKSIESGGGMAVPFYYPGFGESEYLDLLRLDGKVMVDNIINTRIIHWAEKRRAEYENLGVPVFQALPYTRGDQSQWEANQAGIPAQVTPFYLTMPEIAGVIDPMVISARTEDKTQMPIDYQLDSVVDKALKFSALKHKANADKKVAIMFYNYPAGEKNASASFLNVPTSLSAIFKTLNKTGYSVEEKPEQWFIDRTGLMLRPFHRELPYTELPGIGTGTGAGGLLSMERYLAWYNTLPQTTRHAIEAQWGLPGESFTVAEIDGEQQFIIPRSLSGNVMILPQPPRGNRQERERSIYHDKTIPISHNYLAVYLYAREEFGADAIVHLGTHGSHEYLPGKERGLSLYDAGNMAAGTTPIIYPFIMDDVGEALQTKRRGRATVISHLTPPFAKSGLYEELVDLHELMHQYKELDEGGVKARTKEAIIVTVEERNIHQDLAWDKAELVSRFDEFLPELHDYLSELGAQNQPLGLHTFGELPSEEHLVSTLVQMLGKRFVAPAERYAEQRNDQQHEHASANDHDGAVDYRSLKHTPEYKLIRTFVMDNARLDEIKDDELRNLLEEAKANYANFQNIEENSALLEALSGQYVSSATGGDPIRSPDALPTGKNLYGFDPSKIPTQAAWEAGKTLMDDLITNYHSDHGAYPDKLTFTMWSIETMRHLGVVESQVLYAMGVRPVWSEDGRVTGTEIISYSELKRPRVDVVLTATGLYRDAFPNIMMMIAKAIEGVAALKEENNFVYRHTNQLKKELFEAGMTEEEAGKLSTIRIFSNESGNYGTNVGSASMASDTWKKEDKLAKLYLSRMGFFYGSDEKTWSQKLSDIDLYAKNLSGTDAVVFSRSSNVYGLLTSDDPFQYMGGVSLAVRHLDGKSPEMFISNLRDPDNMRNEPMGRFLATELRTRQFHPQWIKEIQAEGYAGTLTTLDVLNNFWGWQVVDPDNVRDDQWQEFFEVYVQDKYELNMREWYEENNVHALAQMIERMLEAARKEYWETNAETLKELLETYVELAQQYDVFTKNETFKEYVNKQAMGFGLAPLTPLVQAETEAEQPQATPQPASQTLEVEGQKMEKMQEIETILDNDAYYLMLLIALFFIGGFFYQFFPWP